MVPNQRLALRVFHALIFNLESDQIYQFHHQIPRKFSRIWKKNRQIRSLLSDLEQIRKSGFLEDGLRINPGDQNRFVFAIVFLRDLETPLYHFQTEAHP